MKINLASLQPYLLLCLLCLGLFLPGITAIPVVDRDEAHFMQASKQMMETGDYFEVRFQETTRFRKPPGINWLQATSVQLFSDATSTVVWPYRVPSVLGALLAVLLLYALAKPYIGRMSALLGASMLACSLLLVYVAHLAVTDAVFLACIILMQGALWHIYQAKHPPCYYPFLFWLAMVSGIAVKGYAPLFALLTMATLCIVDRNIRWLARMRWVWGMIITLIGTSWIWFTGPTGEANYLWQIITTDALPKLVSAHESHGGIPGYHLILLIITFWPGSLFLWHSVTWAWEKRHDATVKFMLAWLLSGWIFYELMPTKLPQYVLPLFPALALLMGLAITNARNNPWLKHWPRLLSGLYIGWAFVSIAFISVLAFVAYLAAGKWLGASFVAIGIVTIGVMVALYYERRERVIASALSMIIAAMLTVMVIFQGVIPQFERIWLSKQVSQVIEKQAIHLTMTEPLWVIGYLEPSLVFWLGTHKVRFIKTNHFSPKSNQQWMLIEEQNLAEFKNFTSQDDLSYTTTAVIDGYNYSKGQWLSLHLLTIE